MGHGCISSLPKLCMQQVEMINIPYHTQIFQASNTRWDRRKCQAWDAEDFPRSCDMCTEWWGKWRMLPLVTENIIYQNLELGRGWIATDLSFFLCPKDNSHSISLLLTRVMWRLRLPTCKDATWGQKGSKLEFLELGIGAILDVIASWRLSCAS